VTRPIPKRIPLQSPIKTLRVEQTCEDEAYGMPMVDWIIWLTANKDFTLGSFIKLCYDGKMLLCTIHPDGSQSEMEISE